MSKPSNKKSEASSQKCKALQNSKNNEVNAKKANPDQLSGNNNIIISPYGKRPTSQHPQKKISEPKTNQSNYGYNDSRQAKSPYKYGNMKSSILNINKTVVSIPLEEKNKGEDIKQNSQNFILNKEISAKNLKILQPEMENKNLSELEEKNKSLEEKNKNLEEKNKSLEEKNKNLEEKNKSLKEKKKSYTSIIEKLQTNLSPSISKQSNQPMNLQIYKIFNPSQDNSPKTHKECFQIHSIDSIKIVNQNNLVALYQKNNALLANELKETKNLYDIIETKYNDEKAHMERELEYFKGKFNKLQEVVDSKVDPKFENLNKEFNELKRAYDLVAAHSEEQRKKILEIETGVTDEARKHIEELEEIILKLQKDKGELKNKLMAALMS
ncbi:hypothetical protein SteCoe_26864 [Stentor coeruleus]|uniref:Uncharacterized protein n=1 Tax=Stentor coeruleus TaxID=5963 RepID=A0A1R2BBT6_9CILI|nr:hypothetical protein SteCoe_26864 [Stentor coeruleus]